MRYILLSAVVLFLFTGFTLSGNRKEGPNVSAGITGITHAIPGRRPGPDLSPAITRISNLYIHKTEALDSFLRTYPRHFYDSSYTVREKKYEELAWYFKQVAGFIVYFEPDLYYDKIISNFHFQDRGKPGFFGVLPDAWLFFGPVGNESDSVLRHDFKKQDTLDQIAFINSATAGYREVLRISNYSAHARQLEATTLLDLLRMEIFRISTIDLANADFDLDEAAMPSLNGSMDSWLLVTGELVKELSTTTNGQPGTNTTGATLRNTWVRLAGATRSYLAANHSYRDFDRMYFTRHYLIPLSHWLIDLQKNLQIPFVKKNSALRSDASDIYAQNIFNADYFAPDKDAGYSDARARLGELLFFDPILSDNNKRACASCHKAELAFSDGLKKSVAFDFDQLPRNSPTVINAGFQKKLFWDTRAASMEDQLDSVVNNANELHSSFDHVIAKLNASPEYRQLFQKAFPASAATAQSAAPFITRQNIKIAIGVYERTLTGLNSRFDQYMRGDTTRLTPTEVSGFNVYMGKAKCGTCHTAPLFGASIPPFFDRIGHQSLGVPVRDTMLKYVVDPDLGVMTINRDSFSRFSFKVPTIRNVELTAPYMHNGVYKTLEQVVDFYDKGAGAQFFRDMRPDKVGLPFFTVLPIPLQLTDTEKKDLVAFLKSLTDTSAATKKPRRLPGFEAPYAQLNTRPIGGEY